MHEDFCNNLIVDYAQLIGQKSPSWCFLRDKNNYSCVDILLYDLVREEVSNVINNIPVNDIPEILEKFGIKPASPNTFCQLMERIAVVGMQKCQISKLHLKPGQLWT